MQLHEYWRQQYRGRRYARHLDRLELNQRIRDVVLNLLMVTPNAKIGLPEMDDFGMRWMELWTHVLEEMVLRHGPYPNGFTPDVLNAEPLPDFAGPLAFAALQVLKAPSLRGSDVLIKLGQPGYMRSLVERGALRLQPASFFSSKNHNGAVRDDELTLPWSCALDGVELGLASGMEPRRIDVEHRSPTDYLLCCMTTSAAPRLFVDFDARACVIIRDRKTFIDRLGAAVRQAGLEVEFLHCSASYVDPLLPSTTSVFVPRAKHFRYSYQHEYRFIGMPSVPAQRLQHVDVELGCLDDIAELVLTEP